MRDLLIKTLLLSALFTGCGVTIPTPIPVSQLNMDDLPSECIELRVKLTKQNGFTKQYGLDTAHIACVSRIYYATKSLSGMTGYGYGDRYDEYSKFESRAITYLFNKAWKEYK